MSVRMWNYRGTRAALFFSFHKCLPLAGPSARLWWWRWKESLPASEESLSPWRHVWPGDCLTPMGMSPRCSHLEEALWLGWVCWENSQGGCFLTTEEELWIRAYIGNLGLKLGRNWNWLPKKTSEFLSVAWKTLSGIPPAFYLLCSFNSASLSDPTLQSHWIVCSLTDTLGCPKSWPLLEMLLLWSPPSQGPWWTASQFLEISLTGHLYIRISPSGMNCFLLYLHDNLCRQLSVAHQTLCSSYLFISLLPLTILWASL